MATLIYPNNTTKSVEPKEPAKGFQLDELYQMLKCRLIEVVHPYVNNGTIAICDEEGALVDSPELNLQASAKVGFRLYGIVLICNEDELK